MALIGVRLSAYQSLSNRDKTILRLASEMLELGEPVRYLDPSANVWLVFDDWRVTLTQLAYLGALTAHITDIPAGYTIPPTRAELQRDIRQYLAARVVLPAAITYTEGGNPWQETLTAQGAPSVVRAGDSVPAGWVPEGA